MSLKKACATAIVQQGLHMSNCTHEAQTRITYVQLQQCKVQMRITHV